MLSTIILIVILLVLLRVITLPIRLCWKILLNSICAMGCLIVLNLLSPLTGMLFDLNVLTAGVVAVLGLPGLCLLWMAHAILCL